MKPTPLMFCLLFLLSTPVYSFSLQQAIQAAVISSKFKGTYQSSGQAIKATLTNLKEEKTSIEVEPGISFVNPNVQDILITEPQIIVLNPGETKDVYFTGYCMEPLNSVPQESDVFQLMQPDDIYQALISELDGNNYDTGLIQEAIWALSEDFPLYGVYEEEDPGSEALLKQVADILGREVPDYTVAYHQEDNEPFQAEPVKVQGEFKYTVEEPSKFSMVVYLPDGELFLTYFEDRPMRAADYTHGFSLELQGYPSGVYTFTLLEGTTPVQEQAIMI
ncbi:MAG: hypothetical protein ACPGED_01650 [Flavobacteriales bacterium]